MTAAQLVAGTPSWRFRRSLPARESKPSCASLEFFTVNIRDRNTRAAYARGAADFLGW